ncbi:MFS transporter [Pyruvatibacter sp.]|uniref:MFS transporter n=1 Tax=Pyruvatibacter sp. TaxID=1981328 RepID=UPI003262FF5D
MTDDTQTSGVSIDGVDAKPTDAGGHRLAYGLLISGLMAFSMGQTVLFAVLGPIAREIELRETHVGVIVTCSALAVMVSSALWGKLADRWGRRPVFVLGLGGYALSTFAFAGVLHAGLQDVMLPMVVLAALIATRVAYGLIASSVQPSAFAYVADITSEQNRSSGMAALGAAFGIGAILGPVMGAALAGFGLVVPIIAAATLALLLALMAWFFLPEPPRGQGDRPPALKLTDARLRPIIYLTLAIFSSFAIIQQTTAFYIQDKFALTPQDTATTVGLMVGGMAFSMLLAQAVIVQVFKPSPGVLVRSGLPLSVLGAIAVMWAPDVPLSMAAFAIFGLGFGLLFPGVNSAASVRVGAEEQGAALGIVSAAMAGGFVLGPLLGTWLYEQTASWPLMLVAALCALGWLATFTMQLSQPRQTN